MNELIEFSYFFVLTIVFGVGSFVILMAIHKWRISSLMDNAGEDETRSN